MQNGIRLKLLLLRRGGRLHAFANIKDSLCFIDCSPAGKSFFYFRPMVFFVCKHFCSYPILVEGKDKRHAILFTKELRGRRRHQVHRYIVPQLCEYDAFLFGFNGEFIASNYLILAFQGL